VSGVVSGNQYPKTDRDKAWRPLNGEEMDAINKRNAEWKDRERAKRIVDEAYWDGVTECVDVLRDYILRKHKAGKPIRRMELLAFCKRAERQGRRASRLRKWRDEHKE
jgi:hypothetical protein